MAAMVFALLLAACPAVAEPAAPSCETRAGVAVLPSPIAPWKGAPLRVIVAAEKPFQGELSLVAPDGKVAVTSRERRGGPPYFWIAEIDAPMPGTWQAQLVRDDGLGECSRMTSEIAVRATKPTAPKPASGSIWSIRSSWSRDTENLYSAWIEKLFDAPLDAAPSWKALHEVLRDRSRNVLFNHLGLGEDESRLIVRPDCADLPYFLRAYFAFKMGLPFGYSNCTRGTATEPPKCHSWWNIQADRPRNPPTETPPQEAQAGIGLIPAASPAPPAAKGPPARPRNMVPAFGHFLQYSIADTVHSGTGRTPLEAENTDTYPVPLSQETLRPGTVYADPYGHLLVLARRVAQTGEAAGVIFAVDAQPDGTVARKRFWRGNFLFATNPVLGGPGFKRFRPVAQDKNGTLRRLSNDEIAKHPDYGDVSLEQAKLSVEEFYDRMDDVMSPAPLDPLRAMKEAITSFEEQVKARVTSVENGRKYQIAGHGDASMPSGPAIFETTGAWEDFATPSRDLRLLIALDVVRGFPDRVARRPDRYAMPKDKSIADVKTELESVLATELAARSFAYTRTNGSMWTLTLKEVVDRAEALEMAYNLNDCVELRWGAADNSDESSTCKRRAPQAQRAKMSEYRPWFRERRRPPRG